MGKIDSIEHLAEQAKSIVNRQSARVAVCVEGLSLDQFHDEIRLSFGGHAAIEQAGDIRMIQARQNLELREKTLAIQLGAQRPA
jgi:hypothetical protein